MMNFSNSMMMNNGLMPERVRKNLWLKQKHLKLRHL